MNKNIKNLINALNDLSNMNKENLIILTSLQDNYIKKLSKIIDRAIAFLETNEYYVTVMYDNVYEKKEELLDILKGSDSNDN